MIGWEIDNDTLDIELYGVGHKLNANELSVKFANILCDTILDQKGYDFIYIELKRVIEFAKDEESIRDAIKILRRACYGLLITKEYIILSPYEEIESHKNTIDLSERS